MKTKHTPGPWRFDKVDSNEESVSYEIHSEKMNWLASIKYGDGGIQVSEKESEANAKLIAAAPELLSELDSFIEVAILVNNENPSHVLMRAIDSAEKAIKKATE